MIDELLVKFLLGECNPDEAFKAVNWIESSAGNRRYFEQFKLIWDKSREIALNSKVDENAAWSRFLDRVSSESFAGNKPNTIYSDDLVVAGKRQPFAGNNLLFRAAALLALVITGILAYFVLRSLAGPEEMQLATTIQAEKTVLPDGSNITLNKNSTLSYPSKFSKKDRRVKLKGEAFFSIQPDRQKPFVVAVNEVTVTVLGTSFNIRETPDSTVIVVETGLVRVNGKAGQVDLKAGEKTTIHHRDGTLKKEMQPDKLYNYYRTKTFTCDNTPLWKLVEVLNEAYGTNIIIGNPNIRNLPLTTTFNEEPIDKILNIISQTLDISLRQEGDTIILQ